MTDAKPFENLSPAMKAALTYARVCRIATVGPRGPHVAPFCPAFDGNRTVYVETQPSRLTIRNLAHSPDVVLLVDDYLEDWSRIWMLSLTGTGRTLREGEEFARAVTLLTEKFPQFEQESLKAEFVLAIDLTGVRHRQNVD